MQASNTFALNKFISVVLHYFKRVNTIFQKINSFELEMKVEYKGHNDRFTNVDWMAQKMLENYMKKYFNNISIVGEEDLENVMVNESEFFNVEEEINLNRIKPEDCDDAKIEEDQLCMYIDPVDSTDQFINRKFEFVTSLIGVVKEGKPFIGFVNYPFYKGEDVSLTYFNIPNKGIYSYNANNDEISRVVVGENKLDEWSIISSGSRTTDQMKNCK